ETTILEEAVKPSDLSIITNNLQTEANKTEVESVEPAIVPIENVSPSNTSTVEPNTNDSSVNLTNAESSVGNLQELTPAITINVSAAEPNVPSLSNTNVSQESSLDKISEEPLMNNDDEMMEVVDDDDPVQLTTFEPSPNKTVPSSNMAIESNEVPLTSIARDSTINNTDLSFSEPLKTANFTLSDPVKKDLDMSIEFSEPLNVSSIDAVNMFKTLGAKVTSPQDAKMSEEDFYTRDDLEANEVSLHEDLEKSLEEKQFVCEENVDVKATKEVEKSSSSMEQVNEEKPEPKAASFLRSVRKESHALKEGTTVENVLTEGEDKGEAKKVVSEEIVEIDDKNQEKSSDQIQVVLTAEQQNLPFHSENTIFSKRENKHTLDEVNEDPINTTSENISSQKVSNFSEDGVQKIDKDEVPEKSSDVVGPSTRKSEVKSLSKSLLLRKTFEQSVFLPDSDSEFDESSKSPPGLEDKSLSMMFPNQTVCDQSNLGSPINDPRGMLSHGFKDQTVFLPYSDSETESSFIGNSVDVYQTPNHQSLSEAVVKTLVSPPKTDKSPAKMSLSPNKLDTKSPKKIDILSLNTGNETTKKMDVTQTEAKTNTVVDNRLFDSINDTMEIQEEIIVSSQNKHESTKNVNTDLIDGIASSESENNKTNDELKVHATYSNAMEVDFEESSNEDALIINENYVETISNEPIIDKPESKPSNEDNILLDKNGKETELKNKGAKKEIVIVANKQSDSKQSVKTALETAKEEPKTFDNSQNKVTESLAEALVSKESTPVHSESIKSKELSKKTEKNPEALIDETTDKSSEIPSQSETNVASMRPRRSTRQTPLKRAVEDLTSEDMEVKSPSPPTKKTRKGETKKTSPQPSEITSLKEEETGEIKSDDNKNSAAQVTPPKLSTSDITKNETPRSGRGKRKQATPLVKEVLTAEASKTENESTPAKGKAPGGEVETPTSLRRSARKASNTSVDAATPVELTPSRRSTRRRTPSVSSETRYPLRNRTPSICSDTSIVEDIADPETTPVRPRRVSAKGRTPSFDLEEGGAKKTALKGGKAKEETRKVMSTRSQKSRESQSGNVSETDEYSDSDNDDRRSWQHDRTRMTDFNLDSEDIEDEEVINFDAIDETRLIVPEFLKTPGNKKKAKQGPSQVKQVDEEDEEKSRKNKRKSKIFHAKDTAGTPTKRMKLRPSALGKIVEEKDAESNVQGETEKGKSKTESQEQNEKKEPKISPKKGMKANASTSKSKQSSIKAEATKSSTEKESSNDETSVSRPKRSSKSTTAIKLEPIAEVTKKQVTDDKKGEKASGKGKESQEIKENSGEKPSDSNDTEVENKPLSRRESRALFAARKSSKMNASTASSASNTSRASNRTGDVTRASSSMMMQSLLNSVKPEAVATMMQMKRSSTTAARGRPSRAAKAGVNEEKEPDQGTASTSKSRPTK
ncbi:hypothetical protein WDU94_006087, partial [Cyamophila willieti]